MVDGMDISRENIVPALPATANVEFHLSHLNPPPGWKLIFHLVSIFAYLAGYAFDALLLHEFYKKNQWESFSITLFIISTASLVVALFSIKLHDDSDSTDHIEKSPRVLMLNIFMFGPLLRSWNCIKYHKEATKSREGQLHAIRLYLEEVRDVDFLSFVYAFLESGPQVSFQLYVLLMVRLQPLYYGDTTGDHVFSILKVIFALTVLAKSMAFYKGDLRKTSGSDFTTPVLLLQITYRLLIIGSRVLAITLFATVSHSYVFIVLGIHFFLMFFWLRGDNTQFFTYQSEKKRRLSESFEILFKVVVAVIYTFCYITTVSGDSKRFQTSYYAMFCFENMCMMAAWFFANKENLDTYKIVLLIAVFMSMIFGILLLVFFYKYAHPRKISKKQECKNEDLLGLANLVETPVEIWV